MEQLQQNLTELAPWGLTYGQSIAILLGVLGVLFVWGVIGLMMRLAMSLIRAGCMLILVFGFGCAITMVFMNLTRN